ncbi:MAG: enoyl-CoA hydratase/isomerase family protein [bacterium]|nr:enoyl-CoA hydratase/isomerase family protein [bacterium]
MPRARGPAVRVGVAGGVARITLPADGGIFAAPDALVDAWEALGDDARIRVLVLDGAVGAFAAPRSDAPTSPAVQAVATTGLPVLACLDGDVSGLGLALALACDLRLATPPTRLGLAEIAGGRLPGGGVTQRLPRLVGPARALEMILLGRSLPARTALAWGLVHRVVPRVRLRAAATALARELAARGPLAMRYGKEAVLRALDLPLADGIALEHDLYVLLQTTADRREGVRAFLARRPPRFRGR